MGPCPRGIVEDVTAQGWWEIIAGHNNRYQENRSGGFLYGHNNHNLVWLCKVSQIHSANILFGHARAHREANGCTRLQTHGLANTRHGLTRVNYVTVSLESPPQSWQITLSTGCPTLGGCYDSVSSDEERGTSPTWNHRTRRQAFTFMLPGCFISLRSLATLIRLVDLFPFASFFFGLVWCHSGRGGRRSYNAV